MASIPTTRRRAQGMQRVDLAYAQLASSEVARDINRDVVLELIRTRQPLSRADLARISGLQPSTVSSIAEQLIQEKWVAEGAAARRPRGRRPTLLSLNPDMVIAVADLHPAQAIIAIVDLNGRLLSRETLLLPKDPRRGVENIIACLQLVIARHPDKSVEGIGISLPGRVDPQTQRLIHAPNLPWATFDIKRAIERKLSIQVEMDNDANACLLSELWFGRMDGIRNAVLVAISEGIGSAILANGQIVTGEHGLAGEFGHISLDPRGPLCGCGRRGCWEMYASSRAALGYYAELAPKAPPISFIEMLKRSEDGDTKCFEALKRQAEYLGLGISIVSTVLAPEVVLLTGGLTASWSRFGPIVEATLAAHTLTGKPPRLGFTSDVELARLRGAAALVLQRHSSAKSTSGSNSRKRPDRRGIQAK